MISASAKAHTSASLLFTVVSFLARFRGGKTVAGGAEVADGAVLVVTGELEGVGSREEVLLALLPLRARWAPGLDEKDMRRILQDMGIVDKGIQKE